MRKYEDDVDDINYIAIDRYIYFLKIKRDNKKKDVKIDIGTQWNNVSERIP